MHVATQMGAPKWLPVYASDTEGAGTGSFSLDDAAKAFMGDVKDEELDEDPNSPPSDDAEGKKKKTGDQSTGDEDDEEEVLEEDDDEEDSSDDDATKKKETGKRVVLDHDADAIVKVKFDGKEHEVKVSDLSRLYGQEASLTKKSTEVAEARKAVETEQTRYVSAAAKLLENASKRWEPYAKLDWMGIQKDPNVSAEDAKALHKEATDAWNEVQYLQSEIDHAVKDAQQKRHNTLIEQGAKTWEELSKPETGIKGWGEKLYGDVTKFAVDNGLPAQLVKELVDPAAIRLLHKAFLYDKAKKVKTTKVNKTPTRIVKESSETATQPVRSNVDGKTAEKRLRQSGNIDDAAAVLLKRMSMEDD